ncbi:MAG: calcium-binding protein, partial [Pseudomonadota bacterium]
IKATGETLTIANYARFNQNASDLKANVDIVFGDGTQADPLQVLGEIVASLEVGTDGADKLFQVFSPVLDGGLGDDTLTGSGNRATDFAFGVGFGDDVVIDSPTSNPAAQNRIVFGAGVTENDATFTIDATGSTLTITLSSGDTMTVPGQFATGAPIISAFVFEDGTELSAADVVRLVNQNAVNERAFIFGTNASEEIDGTDADEQIFGFAGFDTVNGLGGDDFVAGGLGSDQLFGGDGDDVLEGVFFDEINSNFTTESRRPDSLFGGDGDDTLVSYRGDDSLEGAAGNDFLSGDEGDDFYRGGAGDDIIWDERGTDVFAYDRGDGADVIMISPSFSDSADTIRLGAGIAPEDVTYSFVLLEPESFITGDYPFREQRNLDGTLRDFIGYFNFSGQDEIWSLKIDFGGGDEISFINQRFGRDVGDDLNIEFADGTVITGAEVVADLRSGNDGDQ